ncbi:MAG: hypothetical protein Q7U33_07460 [Methylotenera sp.]|jgi:Ca2+-binding EF-hand superfamily protein|uniref:hypothetical protein n=1 Tax=Methylotenera sp. TaxID=2051956 RepID=UPI0027192985|nr:hypothetical protein [Methylotenera sp.]MDO9151197.1 hypothetical protein [Methylotenera sp.]
MKKISLLLFALLSISLSTLSHANQHGAGKASSGSKCDDMNHASFGIAHFDSNKDGVISLQEYLSGDSSNTEKTYQHIDANSDGMLDKEEQQEIEAVYKSIHDQYKAKNNSI